MLTSFFLSDVLNDLFVIDSVALTSVDLSHVGHGKPPFPRLYYGYTAAGGKLYVFGGNIGSGIACFLANLDGKRTNTQQNL